MSSWDLIRSGGLAGMLAGILFALLFLSALVIPEPAPGSFSDVLTSVAFIVALLLLLAALAGFHALQKVNYGRIGRVGYYTVIVGASVQILAQILLLSGITAAEPLDFLGLIGILVGFILYGAATAQARVLPRWCGIGFIVGLPLWLAVSVIFGEVGGILGGVLFGLLWLALGHVLWSQQGEVPRATPRVN